MASTDSARFATEPQWRALLRTLADEGELLGPGGGAVEAGDDGRLEPVKPEEVHLGPARLVDPLKAVFFQAREDLGRYFEPAGPPEAPPRVIVGAAACDLASLKVLDYIFLEGQVVDPQYRSRRERTFVISRDCTEPREVCFCTGVGGRPYPTAGYDINVSPVEGGMVLEAGSERGEGVLAGQDLPRATPEQLAQRDRRRAEVTNKVAEQARAFGLPVEPGVFQERVRRGVEAPLWKREAEKCVECGACNLICPTCHCFLLCDLEEAGGFRRFKNWDACQYAAFARVAGGANPRPRRWERLRNRFDKKFDFFVTHLKEPACTGCGRCVEACPGRIDLREILKELVHE